MRALENLVVVDLTEALAGPYCTMLLGDLGADVIKVERPVVGDQSRSWGARWPGGESAYFCSTNRNKRSLAIDILAPAGQQVMRRLLGRADVFVCNIPREESRKRAGLDSGTLRERFPRLVSASITGYGRSGPSAGRSGYDLVAQGESGLMSVTGEPDGGPIRFPIPLSDMTTGMYAVIGILAALRVRDATGQGQEIDLSLVESQAAYDTVLAGDYFATGKPPRRLGNAHPSIVPYQVFHTADKDVIIAVGSDKQWGQLCRVLGLADDVRDDPRFSVNQARLRHREIVVDMLQQRLSQFESADLLDKLRAAEIPCGPINEIPDLLSDPHYLERGNLVRQEHASAGRITTLANPVRLEATPPDYRLPPPGLGEHNREILESLGYSAEEVEGMKTASVI